MKAFMAAALCAVIILSGGCGVGSNSGSTGSSGGVTISAISGPNHLQIGVKAPASFVYTATVTGSADTAISWSIDNSSLASIDAATGVVTPSATTTGTITITATANADHSKTSTLKVHLVDWILAGFNQIGIGDGVLLVPADGSATVELISPSQKEVNCSWAFDHLSFICQNYSQPGTMQFDIFKTDGTATGTALVRSLSPGIIDTIGFVAAGNPHFSPDGSTVVFGGLVPQSGSFNVGTFVMSAKGGTAPTQLATDTDIVDDLTESPRFTPDGKEILYSQNGAVWIMNADGSNQRQLINVLSQAAVFTPDMASVYYSLGASALGMGLGGVAKADSDGANPVSITPAGFTIADISPNGNSLLLLEPLSGLLGGTTVYVANPDGSNLRGLNGAIWASW